jgi:hypothetical protein
MRSAITRAKPGRWINSALLTSDWATTNMRPDISAARWGCSMKGVIQGSEAECPIRLREVYVSLGRYEHATDNFEQALTLFREDGNAILQADALNGLG